MPKPLEATTDDLDALWHVINERRKGSIMVKVPAETLARVLRDHAKLWQAEANR